MKFGLILLSLFWFGCAHGNETDHYPTLGKPIKDSKKIIDAVSNEMIEKALSVYNEDHKCKAGPPMEDSDLIDKFKVYLNGNKPNPAKVIHKQYLTIIDHIDPKPGPGSIFDGTENSDVICCSPVVNYSGTRMGLDKYDHMWSHGFKYLLNVRKLKKANSTKILGTAVNVGVEDEAHGWGLVLNGNYSGGDLAANLAGFYMYADLLGYDVETGRNKESKHLKCVGGKWTLAKKIDLSNYVIDSFDESLNCSKHANKHPYLDGEYYLKIKKNYIQQNYQCPWDVAACKKATQQTKALIQKYSPSVNVSKILPSVLTNPECKENFHLNAGVPVDFMDAAVSLKGVGALFDGWITNKDEGSSKREAQ